MDDALLKQLITEDHVLDIWNHITGNAVTVVYGQGRHRRRMLIGVERKGSLQSGELYRAATVLCEIAGVLKFWAAQEETPEKAVASVWEKAQTDLLNTCESGVDVTPVSTIDLEFPDGPYSIVWQHQKETEI
ncbi:hypothetical protein [Deinococcus altitudinis]|uniref:hypothetical protein n=1 Tax=Deinococcus altitudinis TaxID=468914 RepID=UPI003891715C